MGEQLLSDLLSYYLRFVPLNPRSRFSEGGVIFPFRRGFVVSPLVEGR
jgi:hypothetical protein